MTTTKLHMLICSKTWYHQSSTKHGSNSSIMLAAWPLGMGVWSHTTGGLSLFNAVTARLHLITSIQLPGGLYKKYAARAIWHRTTGGCSTHCLLATRLPPTSIRKLASLISTILGPSSAFGPCGDLTAPGADRWSRLPGRARWWPPGPRGWRAPCRRRHRSRAVPPLRRSRRRGRLGRWGLRTSPATADQKKSEESLSILNGFSILELMWINIFHPSVRRSVSLSVYVCAQTPSLIQGISRPYLADFPLIKCCNGAIESCSDSSQCCGTMCSLYLGFTISLLSDVKIVWHFWIYQGRTTIVIRSLMWPGHTWTHISIDWRLKRSKALQRPVP